MRLVIPWSSLTLVSCMLLLSGCRGDSREQYRVPGLIKTLKDPDPNQRCMAAQGLGDYGPEAESAVPALTEALKDPDKNVRQAAAYALAEIGPNAQAAIPELKSALRDGDKDVRKAAAYSLKRLAPQKK